MTATRYRYRYSFSLYLSLSLATLRRNQGSFEMPVKHWSYLSHKIVLLYSERDNVRVACRATTSRSETSLSRLQRDRYLYRIICRLRKRTLTSWKSCHRRLYKSFRLRASCVFLSVGKCTNSCERKEALYRSYATQCKLSFFFSICTFCH